MPKSIWELEEEVRRQLLSGVDFGGRVLSVAGLEAGGDLIKWAKLEGENNKMLTVVYVKGMAIVTVHALVRYDESVEITSVSLGKMTCGGSAYGK